MGWLCKVDVSEILFYSTYTKSENQNDYLSTRVKLNVSMVTKFNTDEFYTDNEVYGDS